VQRNGVDRSTGLDIYEQHHRPIRAPSIPKQGHRDFHLNQESGDCGDDDVDVVAKCKLGIRQEQRNEADKESAERSSEVSLKMLPR
jgi:hypothetical protein